MKAEDTLYIERSPRTGAWIKSKKSQSGVVLQISWYEITHLMREAGIVGKFEYVDRLLIDKNGLKVFMEDFDGGQC